MMNDPLHWRYATKKFDLARKVSAEDLNELLEALRLSPSSYGLQPWKFVLVKDVALRQKVREHAWNQEQVTDASYLIILCSLKEISESYVKHYVLDMAQTRDIPVESLGGFEDMMKGFIKGKTPQELSIWMKRQVYIALGMFLSACAQKKIDACPMEGFDPKKVDEVLGLQEQGIESVVLCPIGYRSQEDKQANVPKVRFKKSDIFIEQ